jgi:biotin synthase-like enzyme
MEITQKPWGMTAESIPTGEFWPVEGTPMDSCKAKPIGRDIDADGVVI